MPPRFASFVFAVCTVLLSGCETLSYTAQATFGHLDLMSKRQAMVDIIADASTPDDLKTHLQFVADVREFASRELGLPENGSYRSYAALDREYPVWNVWVTPEFELEPRKSCFPVVGCVPYRGYYSKQSADEYAAEFHKAGDDVSIGGVSAYSTLGFFDDPVTSTMLRLPEERLAGLVFHELAHQVLYVKSNATFNESFARAVEIEGTLRWLASRHDAAAQARYQAALARADIFFAAVGEARAQLSILYAADIDVSEKRRGKLEIIGAMREAQRRRKAQDSAWSVYDPWFSGAINNAKLATVATYFDDVAMFRELLGKADGDFSTFYSMVQQKAAQLEKLHLSSG